MIFRTAEQEADLKASFYRPDRPFFAAGACHVLAGAFLDSTPRVGWNATLIKPHAGFKGMHMFVRNQRYPFDCHGFTPLNRFIDHYFSKMHRWFPGWSADLVDLNSSPIGEEFCTKYQRRMPEQFLENPISRAVNYVQRFEIPADAYSPMQSNACPSSRFASANRAVPQAPLIY